MATVEIAPRIVVDEKVCFGKPVIKGTRVPVIVVLHELANGMNPERLPMSMASQWRMCRLPFVMLRPLSPAKPFM